MKLAYCDFTPEDFNSNMYRYLIYVQFSLNHFYTGREYNEILAACYILILSS
jgi:hypothetical protein